MNAAYCAANCIKEILSDSWSKVDTQVKMQLKDTML